MNKLIIACIIIFLLIGLGKVSSIFFLNHFFIQLPLYLSLSVLSGVGFTISLMKCLESTKGNKLIILNSIVFASFLVSIIGMQLYGGKLLLDLPPYESLEVARETDILSKLSEGDSEEKRKYYAQVIFHEYGAVMPYKTNSGQYQLFIPNENDIRTHTEIKSQIDQIKLSVQSLHSTIKSLFMYAFIELILFFISASATALINIHKGSKHTTK